MRVAWRTKVIGIESICSAETRAKAKYKTLRSAFDAHYQINWNEIRAVRAPEHDAWAEEDESRICWGEEFLRRKL